MSAGASDKSGSKRVGKYEILKTIGEGSLGKVKLAEDIVSHEKVAIKILDKEKIKKQNMSDQIKKEISIMKTLKHPNIVNLKEVLGSNNKIFIVLEYVPNGELFEYIEKKTKLTEDEARSFFREIVAGVAYIHSNNICHRDIKPENLLMDRDNHIKISDFGLSAFNGEDVYDESSLLHTTCGSPNYVAPEVLKDNGYNGRLSDIWSVGVVLFVMVAGYLPFDEPTLSTLFRRIQSASYTNPAWFSDDLKDLLSKILVPDPQERISFTEIYRHPWYLGTDLTEEQGIQMAISQRSMSISSISSRDHLGTISENGEEQSTPALSKSSRASTVDCLSIGDSVDLGLITPKMYTTKASVFELLTLSVKYAFRNIFPPVKSKNVNDTVSIGVILTTSSPDKIVRVIRGWCQEKQGKCANDINFEEGKIQIAYNLDQSMIKLRLHVCRLSFTTSIIYINKLNTKTAESTVETYEMIVKEIAEKIPDCLTVDINEMKRREDAVEVVEEHGE